MPSQLTNLLLSESRGRALVCRVESPHLAGASVVAGHGAFYSIGGRYNRPHQPTVYAAVDPITALTESAYYEARFWQAAIGGQPNLPKPTGRLRRSKKLWFVAVAGQEVAHYIQDRGFGFLERECRNPSHDYENLRNAADRVRAYANTNQHLPPVPIGVLYPSVRAPGYPDAAYALFVTQAQQTCFFGIAVESWDVDIEFLTTTGQPTSGHPNDQVDWSKFTASVAIPPRTQVKIAATGASLVGLVDAAGNRSRGPFQINYV